MEKPGKLAYLEAVHYIFQSEKWLLNTIFAGLCMLSTSIIPFVGLIVLYGYQFEIVQALHENREQHYPDFNIQRFGDYLLRGLWSFLTAIVSGLAVTPLFFAIFAVLALGGILVDTYDSNTVSLLIAVGIGLVAFLLFLGIIFAFSLPTAALILRAGLSQQFAGAFHFTWVKQFISNVWREAICSTFFLFLISIPLLFGGMLLCCIGMHLGAGILMMIQAHLFFQLYELHLRRGGEAIPLKTKISADRER